MLILFFCIPPQEVVSQVSCHFALTFRVELFVYPAWEIYTQWKFRVFPETLSGCVLASCLCLMCRVICRLSQTKGSAKLFLTAVAEGPPSSTLFVSVLENAGDVLYEGEVDLPRPLLMNCPVVNHFFVSKRFIFDQVSIWPIQFQFNTGLFFCRLKSAPCPQPHWSEISRSHTAGVRSFCTFFFQTTNVGKPNSG